MSSIDERVALGSAWLDIHYPGWWKSIDLGTLSVSSCHECVLGQVYSGHIPADEQAELVAQVLANMRRVEARVFAESLATQQSGGFNVLYELHEMRNTAPEMGFSIHWERFVSDSVSEEYTLLTDAWTKVVISRRMAGAELAGVA